MKTITMQHLWISLNLVFTEYLERLKAEKTEPTVALCLAL